MTSVLHKILQHAISTVIPPNAIAEHVHIEKRTLYIVNGSYDLSPYEKRYFSASGKTAGSMTSAMEMVFGAYCDGGKYG